MQTKSSQPMKVGEKGQDQMMKVGEKGQDQMLSALPKAKRILSKKSSDQISQTNC